MNKLKLFFIFIFLVFSWLYFLSQPQSDDLTKYTILQKTIEWDSMKPLLKNGEKVDLVVWYYKDNDPKVWDIIAFNYGWWKHAYIKMIKATFSDDVEIKQNNLLINGEVMKNSIWEVYQFLPWEIKMLWLYAKDWNIPEGSYLIFWDNVTDSVDSRKFWAVSKDDMYWKFLIK